MSHNAHTQDGWKYEEKELNVRKLTVRGIIFATAILLVYVIVWLGWFNVKDPILYPPKELPAGALTLEQLRAKEDSALYSYRALNAAQGKYQIPIDSAIKILAREAGVPTATQR